jgi:hypothetical protein
LCWGPPRWSGRLRAGRCADHEHHNHPNDVTRIRWSIFWCVGQYEQLDGVASGEIDPKGSLNAVIQDIELAPRNSRAMVEYSMDFSILNP